MSKVSPIAWLTRCDGSVVLGHGPFDARDKPSDGGVSFYVQDYGFSDRSPWKIPRRVEHLTAGEFAARFFMAGSLDCNWQPLDAGPFAVVFQEIMSAIHAGVFEKTVPVVTESGVAGVAAGPEVIGVMARQSLPLHSYGWTDGDSGFAGASPELLFSLRGNHLETMALAGTAKSEDRDVFAVDEKEIREHEYVAQTLVSKLLDLGKLERRPREIIDLGSIVHFLTLISVELADPPSPADLLRRLHPTPALGPLPRTDETLQLLLSWRKRLGCPPGFGAPFGLMEGDSFDAIVAIRGIWWEDNRLALPAGCGIIEASRLVNEWRELRLKREAVKRF